MKLAVRLTQTTQTHGYAKGDIQLMNATCEALTWEGNPTLYHARRVPDVLAT